MKIQIELGQLYLIRGGLQICFNRNKKLILQFPSSQITLRQLITHIIINQAKTRILLKPTQNATYHHRRPGIIVVINNRDLELLGKEETILWNSYLHYMEDDSQLEIKHHQTSIYCKPNCQIIQLIIQIKFMYFPDVFKPLDSKFFKNFLEKSKPVPKQNYTTLSQIFKLRLNELGHKDRLQFDKMFECHPCNQKKKSNIQLNKKRCSTSQQYNLTPSQNCMYKRPKLFFNPPKLTQPKIQFTSNFFKTQFKLIWKKHSREKKEDFNDLKKGRTQIIGGKKNQLVLKRRHTINKDQKFSGWDYYLQNQQI